MIELPYHSENSGHVRNFVKFFVSGRKFKKVQMSEFWHQLKTTCKFSRKRVDYGTKIANP